MARYFSQNCNKRDKTFWNTVSHFMTNKKFRDGSNIILNEGDRIINENGEVADIFNDFFSNVASTIGFEDAISSTKEAIDKHKTHPSVVKVQGKFGHLNNTFNFQKTTSEVISKKLRSLDIRKATGYDNIPAKLLRLGGEHLCFPIANLINTCIDKSLFPGTMKRAEVSPVYKKSDNLVKGNYRPVSVLTTISKIYESVVNDQMYDFFNELFEGLLTAFRKGYTL